MGFTKKEKNFILKNYNELSLSKIAEILQVNEKQISEFLIKQNLVLQKEKPTSGSTKSNKEIIFGNFQYKTFKTIMLENSLFWISIFAFIFLLYIRSFSAVTLSDEMTLYESLLKGTYTWKNFIFSSDVNHYWSYLIFGINPWGNRLFTLVLHCLNILLFFAIFRNFISEKILKIAIVLLASHSLVVETITWVAANPYAYHALIYLLILYSSLLYERTSKIYFLIPYYFLIIKFTLTGGHTNFAPIFAIIFNLFILKRSFKKEAIVTFWLILLIPVFNITNKAAVDARIASLTTGPYFEKFLQTIPFTVGKSLEIVFFPYNLALFHEETLNIPYYAFLRIITIFFFGLMIYLLFKKEKIYFGLAALACAFCIYIFSPIQISWFVAERYLYLPIFIVCVFLALFFNYLNNKVPNLGSVLFATYFIFFLFVSFNRMEVWQSLITLWEENAKNSPDSYRVRNNLAESYTKLGDFPNAEKQYYEAARINPNFVEAYFNLSNSLISQNKLSEAEKYLVKTIQMNPALLDAYLKLAIIKGNQNDFSSAYSYIDKALEINPNSDIGIKIKEEIKKYEAQQKN